MRRAAAARGLVGLLVTVSVVVLPATAHSAAPPDTKITAGPTGLSDSRTASFTFKSVRGATFKCRLDDAAWSKCTSPKTYRKLAQGDHTFKVRASKNGRVDRTPASRVFVVDTRAPATTISEGPTGTSQERTPTFTFGADESSTFTCRLAKVVVDPCSSPFSPAEPLADDFYTFSVTATDLAGNADATPATREFGVDTPLAYNMATAEQAAELYFPDTIDLDVPARCSGDMPVDCPDGTGLPATHQLRSASTRVVTSTDTWTYTVTVTSSVSTLAGQSIATELFGTDCNLTLNSAEGSEPTWQVVLPLQFRNDPWTNERQLVPGEPAVTTIESDDARYSGAALGCSFIDPGPGFVQDIYESTLASHFDVVGRPLCAAPGSSYLGPCSDE